MSFESILETQAYPDLSTDKAGLLNALAAGATAVVGVGTEFTTDYIEGDLMSFMDSGLIQRYYTIETITDNLNIVLAQPTVSVSGAGLNHKLATSRSPYIIGGDAKALSANELPVYAVDTDLGYVLGDGNPLDSRPDSIRYFDFNIGCELKSIYVRLPYQYTLSTRNYPIRIFQQNRSDTLTSAVLNLGQVLIPVENTETPLNAYVAKQFGTEDWALKMNLSGSKKNQVKNGSLYHGIREAPMVSNINAPAALTGEYMPLIIGARVEYSKILTI